MRNVVVLGSGRSGTSMAMGLLATAGYAMGGRPHRANASNPKGFFEGPQLNAINEAILRRYTPARPWLLDRVLFPYQRWVARIPLDVEIGEEALTPRLVARMRSLTRGQPYCLKDPRFSYTLEAWRPYLSNPLLLCVFRHPTQTARSLLEECRNRFYMTGVEMDTEAAFEMWRLMYQRILGRLALRGDWLFVHYDQIVDGSQLEAIESRTGARIDRSFPERALRRCDGEGDLPPEVAKLYGELCERAGHVPARAEPA